MGSLTLIFLGLLSLFCESLIAYDCTMLLWVNFWLAGTLLGLHACYLCLNSLKDGKKQVFDLEKPKQTRSWISTGHQTQTRGYYVGRDGGPPVDLLGMCTWFLTCTLLQVVWHPTLLVNVFSGIADAKGGGSSSSKSHKTLAELWRTKNHRVFWDNEVLCSCFFWRIKR